MAIPIFEAYYNDLNTDFLPTFVLRVLNANAYYDFKLEYVHEYDYCYLRQDHKTMKSVRKVRLINYVYDMYVGVFSN